MNKRNEIDRFIVRAKETIEQILDIMAEWSDDLHDKQCIKKIIECFDSLAHQANALQIDTLANESNQLVNIFQSLAVEAVDVDYDLHGKLIFGVEYLLSEIEKYPNCLDYQNFLDVITDLKSDIVEQPSASKLDQGVTISNEILSIFTEEAEEIIQALQEILVKWQEDEGNEAHFRAMHRQLHTLKGASKLAGFNSLGDFAHQLEAVITHLLQDNTIVNQKYFSKIKLSIDEINHFIHHVKQGVFNNEMNFNALPSITNTNPEHSIQNKSKKPINQAKKSSIKPVVTTETIKFDINRLEYISNLVINTNIAASNISQKLYEMQSTLNEGNALINRLKDIVNHINVKSSRKLVANENKYHEFDFLEFDHYSSIEKLTHTVNATASQLSGLHDSLTKSIGFCDNIAVEQTKSSKQIEEEIIRVRTVPFEALKPRFDRIIAQVSQELNKKVSLTYTEVEGELDRVVIDKILSPIEHLIRNAIDHGIESTEERLKQGKNRIGNINLSLIRKSADVIIELSDDGRGICSDTIYHAALKKGLIREGAVLTNREIIDLIMLPGFSTRESVTHISGRGIGMDVVNSEVKKLGGSFMITSDVGKGATFTLRFPFTMSLSKMIIFNINNKKYALPLSSLTGVTRVEKAVFLKAIDGPEGYISYLDCNYKVITLDHLSPIESPMRFKQNHFPVLLLNIQEPVALVIDKIIETKEIVIKTIGSQLKCVQMISGATLLDDGSVALVLDPLILSHLANDEKPIPLNVVSESKDKPRVLVVDDSLTVRKITASLLQRFHYDVETAADGLDALNRIKHQKPSIILLDTEMPNMDGYEFLKTIRADDLFKTVPVIMITSRTSDKHKQKALMLGANLYLSKPFNDNELFDAMKQLLGH